MRSLPNSQKISVSSECDMDYADVLYKNSHLMYLNLIINKEIELETFYNWNILLA